MEKSKLQLVGVTAMLLASKYEEMYAPEIRDFVFITDDTYSSEEIRKMERQMLKVLDYSLGTPLCLHFLRRYSRAGEVKIWMLVWIPRPFFLINANFNLKATPEVHTMGKFLMELCLPDYNMLEFTPSKQAAAALYLSKVAQGASGWVSLL